MSGACRAPLSKCAHAVMSASARNGDAFRRRAQGGQWTEGPWAGARTSGAMSAPGWLGRPHFEGHPHAQQATPHQHPCPPTSARHHKVKAKGWESTKTCPDECRPRRCFCAQCTPVASVLSGNAVHRLSVCTTCTSGRSMFSIKRIPVRTAHAQSERDHALPLSCGPHAMAARKETCPNRPWHEASRPCRSAVRRVTRVVCRLHRSRKAERGRSRAWHCGRPAKVPLPTGTTRIAGLEIGLPPRAQRTDASGHCAWLPTRRARMSVRNSKGRSSQDAWATRRNCPSVKAAHAHIVFVRLRTATCHARMANQGWERSNTTANYSKRKVLEDWRRRFFTKGPWSRGVTRKWVRRALQRTRRTQTFSTNGWKVSLNYVN